MKSNPFLRIPSVLVVACAASAQAADLTWNAALPGDWNTSNTNWSGSTWSNGAPDNAIFTNISGAITLTEAITGGSLSFNAGDGNEHYTTLTGSNLSLGSVSVLGGYNPAAGNAPVDSIPQAYAQRLTVENMTANVSGNAAVGRGMLYLNGAIMNVGGTILSNNAWQVFRADNSTVSATGGIDFSSIASQVELYGGAITTPSIKVGNYTFSGGGGGLYLSGVTLVATQDNADYIQVYNDGNTASRAGARLYGNGVILNSNGHAVTIDTVLFGDGFLTKTGTGTLTLSKSNTYTSNTSVNEGTLEISATGKLYGGGYIFGPVVTVASGTTLRLNGWNYDAAGSLGDLDFSRQLLVVNGGTIEYAGNSNDGSNGGAAGRNFTVGTGGATINVTTAGQTLTIADNAGYGALINDNGLTLGGVGDGVIGKVISGTGSLTKSGSGTWTLTGANTYSGGTTVSAGTLILDGASGGASRIVGDLTVNSGATVALTNGDTTGLGYNGGAKVTSLTIDGGTVTTAGVTHIWNFSGGVDMTGGTLQSNNGVSDPNGPQMEWINADVFTNASVDTATIGGRINMRADGGATGINFTVADGAAATDLLVSAAITQASAGLGITKNDSGTMVLSGINTYTGNTTINEGTVVLADDAQLTFAVTDTNQNLVGGVGTATFNGDFNINTSAVTGTNGGIWLLVDVVNLNPASSFEPTFNVIGFTQQGDGVTWTMTDAKGDWSFDESTGELTLDVGSDYDDWANANGVTGGEDDDDDADGLTNLEEYAFGTDPTGGSSVNPIVVPLDKATGTFSYTRRATPASTGLSYTVWTSTDLGTWTQDTGATEGTIVTSGEVETVPVIISPALLSNSKLFIQVRAQ